MCLIRGGYGNFWFCFDLQILKCEELEIYIELYIMIEEYVI